MQSLSAVNSAIFAKVVDPIISNIVNPIIMLLFAVGLLVFAYGIFEMVWNGSDSSAREKGRTHMLGGVIGMFVMLSAWGLIYIIAETVKSFQ
jgi:hypothetical protein